MGASVACNITEPGVRAIAGAASRIGRHEPVSPPFPSPRDGFPGLEPDPHRSGRDRLARPMPAEAAGPILAPGRIAS